MTFLTYHRLISIDQSAYRPQHNTQKSLHRVVDDWLENMGDKLYTALCFLDIRKCFDTINHAILLDKLIKYGINGKMCEWVKSYLYNRSQCVAFNGKVSNTSVLNIGVPQGSVLGPILFLLYVNDMPLFGLNSCVNMYADDSVIYCTGDNINDITCLLQDSIDSIITWYNNNRLVINAEKSKSMIICPKNKPHDHLNVLVNDQVLLQVNDMKYLGININSKMSWTTHVNMLAKSVSYKLLQLRRTISFTSYKVRNTLFMSTIQPCLDYAITVWGYTTDANLNIIQRLQNRGARIVLNNFDYINVRSNELLIQLGWMSVKQRRTYFTYTMMFKCIHGLAPDYMCNNVTMQIDINNRLTRAHPMNVYVPFSNNCSHSNTFNIAGAREWNLLPSHIKDTINFDAFKKKVKIFLKT